jgi:hypothetical protein
VRICMESSLDASMETVYSEHVHFNFDMVYRFDPIKLDALDEYCSCFFFFAFVFFAMLIT